MFDRLFECFEYARAARLFVAFHSVYDRFNLRNDREERNAAAGDDAFFYGSSGSCESVLDTEFLFLHFDFGSSTYVDYRNAACEFSKSFLKFFFVVFGSGFCDLSLDGIYSSCNSHFVAVTAYDSGVVLVYFYLFSSTEHSEVGVFEFVTYFAGDYRTAGQGSDIFEHSFSSVTETGSLNCYAVEYAFEFVEYDSRQSVTVHIFADDEELKTVLNDLFEYRHNVFAGGYLLVSD